MEIKESIKIFRIANNMTQEQLANVIGCSTNAYIQKEKGRVDFTVNEIIIIKKYFNLSIEKTWSIFFESKLNKSEI